MTDRSAMRRLALPAALGTALAAGLAFGALVRLPHLFAYSDAALVGGLTAALALGLVQMLPDRWLHDEARLIRHAFSQRHSVTEARAQAALDAIQRLHADAARLARAEAVLAPEAAARARRVRARLAETEGALFQEPGLLPIYQAVVVRADTAIEAVEGQANLRRTRADEARVTAGRARAEAALGALDEALDAAEARRLDAIGHGIDVAAATAETLMGRPARAPEREGDRR